MRKKEADRLKDIANVLDDHSYDVYYAGDTKQAHWFHWGAQEIRKVIMNGGFNGITDAKYSKVEEKWELKEE